MSKPQLGYWKIRGLASNLRYQLAYQGVDYEMVEYEQADDFSVEEWTSVKFTLGFEFPNLPYFVDGDFKMTETMPIHKYIADKWTPELLGKDAQTRAQVNMVANVIGELKNAVTMGCYTNGDLDALKVNIHAKTPAVVAFLGAKKFLAGEEPTWIDFYFVEVVELMSRHESDFFVTYPTLMTYKESVFGLPKLAEYLASDACLEKTRSFNNKSAKINYNN